ncbi:hypothetical protein KY285_008526 [Solanum tuberosum]|nr:hypothetical protein KY285_008526 [Solanum tuberosum]
MDVDVDMSAYVDVISDEDEDEVAESSRDMICLTNISNMYEILWNNVSESSDENVVNFYMYGVLESDNKRRNLYLNGFYCTAELYLARLDIGFDVENSDIQDIVHSMSNYLMERALFFCSENVFDGKKQEFRELLCGLKIMTVGEVLLKNNFELADDICPICFGKFCHESVMAVTTPCSHGWHWKGSQRWHAPSVFVQLMLEIIDMVGVKPCLSSGRIIGNYTIDVVMAYTDIPMDD